MWKLSLASLALALILSACMPTLPFLGGAGDAQATANAVAGTLAAQTVEALPTPTLVPPTNTPSPTATTPPPPTATFTPLITDTPTATPIGGLPTAQPDATPPADTSSPSLIIDTPPPSIPQTPLVLNNRSKAPVSLTLYGTTSPHEYSVYYEYDFTGTLTVTIPTGTYRYVAWVGGKKFTGSFTLKSHKLTLSFYKDKVSIH